MNVMSTTIPKLLVLESQVFGDDRGFFFDSFNAPQSRTVCGHFGKFLEDKH